MRNIFDGIIKAVTNFFNSENDERTQITIDDIIDYLEIAEGSQIHKNKTEKTETAFYGVCREKNQEFNGWLWLERIAEKEGLQNYTKDKESLGKLNSIIEEKYKNKYVKYAKEYHANKITKMHLDSFPSKKTALTYFSIHTNSGNTRSKKILIQSLNDLGIKVTYKTIFEKENLKLLTKSNPNKLNKRMLINMQFFYDYLVSKNPSKYAIYANGWRNRLEKLK